MSLLSLTLLLAVAEPDDGLSKKMQPHYLADAESYALAVESDPKTKLEFRKEPVFQWSNPARTTTQGAVFLWLRDGRPSAIVCMLSYPHHKLPGRVIAHEFHALDREKLIVARDSANQWKPEVGLERKGLPGAPAPAGTSGGRLVQMRKLAQEFGGHSVDRDGNEWQLRLLPNPLYRYPSAKTGVVDGALFALMSNAGTDPEVLLVIEAVEANGKMQWEYACGQFSDWNLHVRHKDTEVFTYDRNKAFQPGQPRLQLYRWYAEKVVTSEGKVIARVRSTPRGPQMTPIEDK